MNSFQEYVNDGDAFALWASSIPDVAEQVTRDLSIVSESLNCPSVAVMEAGRDAVWRLFDLAHGVGFEDMAAIFYARYEWFCRQIFYWVY